MLGEVPKHQYTGWQFNDEDRDNYSERYWACPARLVHKGMLASVWSLGRGGASSILPVLAVHTWPKQKGAESSWTGYTTLSRRRIATLSGLDKDTVTVGLRSLKSAGLLQLKRVPRSDHQGGYQTQYRLRSSLYANERERFVPIRACLFYGGTWAVLPTPAMRHLYIVTACLDPIGDEDRYLEKIKIDGADRDWFNFGSTDLDLADFSGIEEYEEAVKQRLLDARRSSATVSLSELQRHSGLSRCTVISAIRALLVPIFDANTNDTRPVYPPIALLKTGDSLPRSPTWYVPDRRVNAQYWKPEFLNDPIKVRDMRRRFWPSRNHQLQVA